MKPTTLSLIAALVLGASACGDDAATPSSDATDLDTAADDAGGDVAVPDAVDDADQDTDDAGGDDTTPPDIGVDTTPDVDDDVAAGDAGVDGGDDTAVPDTGPVDQTAPTFRDIRIALGEPANTEFDLNTADHLEHLATPVTISARVFARDDSPVEDLSVALVAADDPSTALPEQTARFETGLWIIEATAAAGTDVVVSATDAAGNTGVSAHRLVLPSPAESMARTWERRTWTSTGTIDGTVDLAFRDDGTWCVPTPDGVEAGTWQVEDDELSVVTIDGATCDDPADEGASYLTRTAPFHVDRTYFSQRPLLRTEGSTGLAGTWAVTVVETDGDVVREVTTTLDLSDDGTFEEHVRTYWRDTVPPEANATRSGTWEIMIDEHYEDSVGDFLVRQVLEDPDPEAAPYQVVELYVIRAGRLLLDPDLDP